MKQNGGTIFLGRFVAFRSILENYLLEEICLELKITLKNVIKNVPEGIFDDSKKFSNAFDIIFQCNFLCSFRIRIHFLSVMSRSLEILS